MSAAPLERFRLALLDEKIAEIERLRASNKALVAELEMSRQSNTEYRELLESKGARNAALIEMLVWIERYEPQIVAAAEERFNIHLVAGGNPG